MSKRYVWLLDVQGPGTLGGPMGTEHTDHWDTLLFATEKSAKAYAEKQAKGKVNWNGRSNGNQCADCLFILFDLEKKEVLP